MAKTNLNGALLGLAAFAIYAVHDVIVKSLGGTYAPFQIMFFAVMFSFPLTVLIMMRDKTMGNLRPRHPWWTALRTVAAVVTGVCAFYAFAVLPLAQTYAILFAAPLLITVLSIPILGETVRLRRWIAVVIGLVGVLIVLRPGQTELTLGHWAALVAAGTGALASVIVRKIGREERSVVLLLYPMMTNFVVMGTALPFVYRPMPVEHLGAFGLMAALGVLASLVLIGAYRSGEAAVIAPMQYSQIIWATAFGFLIFDETVDLETGIGAAIVIASGLYIVLRESRSSASENMPVLRTRSRPETAISPRVSSLLPDDAKPPLPGPSSPNSD
ncbi:MAG: DMT family transporter [Dinoroseobacter sp.]|nr:DMT family transporter [Dinoroseobacter sp.]